MSCGSACSWGSPEPPFWGGCSAAHKHCWAPTARGSPPLHSHPFSQNSRNWVFFSCLKNSQKTDWHSITRETYVSSGSQASKSLVQTHSLPWLLNKIINLGIAILKHTLLLLREEKPAPSHLPHYRGKVEGNIWWDLKQSGSASTSALSRNVLRPTLPPKPSRASILPH